MKHILFTFILCAGTLIPAKALSQTPEEIKAYEAYMTPGEAHKMMAEESGTWENQIKYWADAEADAAEAIVMCEAKMIMNGLYQEMNYKGDMMGMPFEGKSILSYNNKTGEYTNTWIDNMGSGLMVLKGKGEPGAKSYTLYGEMTDPVTGKAIKIRQVYTLIDNNTRKIEMYDTKDGKKEYKNMEIVMTRK